MSTHPFRHLEPQLPEEPSSPETAFQPDADQQPFYDAENFHASANAPARTGGRQLLGGALALLAALWIGYSAWQAGRVVGSEPLTSPALAQWIAIATGPLALLGLVWLMFGRTRRREAEKFTRSVIAMRAEARALQDVLAALGGQIDRNHGALGQVAGELMGLGDQAATRLGAITSELNAGSKTLADHGAALDRAAEAARVDIGVLLADLPRAEQVATQMADRLREAGRSAIDQSAAFEAQVERLAASAGHADTAVGTAAERLVAHLTHIESASAAATARLSEAATSSSDTVDALLIRSAEALDQVRHGIDQQAASVAALLSQSEAGIGRAGIAASEALSDRLGGAGSALDSLSARIAEQERASQRLVADLDNGLGLLDQRFAELASSGDERVGRVARQVAGLRAELASLGSDAGANDQAILAIADRTQALREGVGHLSQAIAAELTGAIHEAEESAARLHAASSEAHPKILGARDAAVEASERIAAGGAAIDAQHQRLSALLAAVDDGVGGAHDRLAELGRSIADTSSQAERLSAETGPALVAALVQVREAASHAAERAQAAIREAIPASASQLGDQARAQLERALRDVVGDQLAEIDRLATKAVESARAASETLTQQMLSIGSTAAALDAHLEERREAERRDGGEHFARHVALLIDSMHSASIDVQKILSDEVDEKAWAAYLKGDRGVFTRRAARLIGASEAKPLQAHYDSDPEFHQSVNRYVADFEAMLRRVMGERDGGSLAVTLMGSDMGKLYAALSQAIERRR
ncbi:hypothetical protein ABDK56_00980 [Sphingomonas sp. ASV193]|uniref:hypothetical protein n=1 Tax=Sphingomonas sp. ASV193 TaxID=3144405 RepID=UPI0032E8AE3B